MPHMSRITDESPRQGLAHIALTTRKSRVSRVSSTPPCVQAATPEVPPTRGGLVGDVLRSGARRPGRPVPGSGMGGLALKKSARAGGTCWPPGDHSVELTQACLDDDAIDDRVDSSPSTARAPWRPQPTWTQPRAAGRRCTWRIVSDNVVTRGLRTTSKILGDWVSPLRRDLVTVKIMAGLPIVGKTNMMSLRHGGSSNIPAFGATNKNPGDTERILGGGSARCRGLHVPLATRAARSAAL